MFLNKEVNPIVHGNWNYRPINRPTVFKSLLRASCTIAVVMYALTLAAAQEMPHRLCDDFQRAVQDQFDRVEIRRNDRFTSDCKFEFHIGENDRVYISIEHYSSRRLSQRNFKNDAEMLESGDFGVPPRYTRKTIDGGGKWDNILVLKSDLRENLMLLRRRKYVITLITTRFEILLSLEARIKEFDFETR